MAECYCMKDIKRVLDKADFNVPQLESPGTSHVVDFSQPHIFLLHLLSVRTPSKYNRTKRTEHNLETNFYHHQQLSTTLQPTLPINPYPKDLKPAWQSKVVKPNFHVVQGSLGCQDACIRIGLPLVGSVQSLCSHTSTTTLLHQSFVFKGRG